MCKGLCTYYVRKKTRFLTPSCSHFVHTGDTPLGNYVRKPLTPPSQFCFKKLFNKEWIKDLLICKRHYCVLWLYIFATETVNTSSFEWAWIHKALLDQICDICAEKNYTWLGLQTLWHQVDLVPKNRIILACECSQGQDPPSPYVRICSHLGNPPSPL